MRSIIFILLLLSTTCFGQRRTMHLNTGRATHINAAGKRSSVSVANPPYKPYYDAQTGTITFDDTHFQYSRPGVSETGFVRRSPGGFVKFRTSVTSIDVKVGGDWSTATSVFDEQSAIEVLVNGTYNQSVTLTADNTTQTYTITLPAGTNKIIELRNGYSANPSSDDNIQDNGVYVQGVVTAGTIEIEKPVLPVDLWYIEGNSITTGASSSHPLVTGWPMILRAEGWQIELDSYGAKRLLSYDAGRAHAMIEHMLPRLVGTNSTKVINMLGTNNWAIGGGQPKATWKLEYQLFLDSLHARRPDVTIICVSPLNRTGYSTLNAQGATMDDYADAITELLVTRTWAKYIYGKNLVSIGNLTDGLHPNTAGHIEIAANLKTAINALVMIRKPVPAMELSKSSVDEKGVLNLDESALQESLKNIAGGGLFSINGRTMLKPSYY